MEFLHARLKYLHYQFSGSTETQQMFEKKLVLKIRSELGASKAISSLNGICLPPSSYIYLDRKSIDAGVEKLKDNCTQKLVRL